MEMVLEGEGGFTGVVRIIEAKERQGDNWHLSH